MAVKVKKEAVKSSTMNATKTSATKPAAKKPDPKKPEPKKAEVKKSAEVKKPTAKKPEVKKPVNQEPIDKKESTTETPKEGKTKKEKMPVRDGRLSQSRFIFAIKLCLEQKYLDEDIIERTNKEFIDYPGKKFDRKELDRVRWMFKDNQLLNLPYTGQNYKRCVMFEGNVVSKRDTVIKRVSKRIKVTEANKDPLFNIAGVNVHDNK